VPVLLGPALAAAGLLALAGAQKLLDPTMTVGALRALRLPASALLVRVGSAAELVIGAGAIAGGGAVLWALVGLSYLAFSVFVVAALRSETMIGTCGCFGRDETPPHVSHVALNLGFAAVAGAAAVAGVAGVDDLTGSLPARLGLIGLVVVALGLSYACYVELPRTLQAARSLRELDLRSLTDAGGPR
jgi:hypothetical protein